MGQSGHDQYQAPAQFDKIVASLQERAEQDESLAEALRGLPLGIYGQEEYARGVLTVIGLGRLGDDYAGAFRHVARLTAQLPEDPVAEGQSFFDMINASPSTERANALAVLQVECARLAAIEALIDQLRKAGMTQDYDPSPC